MTDSQDMTRRYTSKRSQRTHAPSPPTVGGLPGPRPGNRQAPPRQASTSQIPEGDKLPTDNQLPLVLLPTEVVKVLRLDEVERSDGSIRRRAMPDALRSLEYLHTSGQVKRLPGCRRRYARDAVLNYLRGTLTK